MAGQYQYVVNGKLYQEETRQRRIRGRASIVQAPTLKGLVHRAHKQVATYGVWLDEYLVRHGWADKRVYTVVLVAIADKRTETIELQWC